MFSTDSCLRFQGRRGWCMGSRIPLGLIGLRGLGFRGLKFRVSGLGLRACFLEEYKEWVGVASAFRTSQRRSHEVSYRSNAERAPFVEGAKH